MKKNIWQKQLPTIIGIGILVIALIGGVIVTTIGGGPGVFAPRATAETTPQKIKVTNVTDTGFTVSFVTQGKTAGFVKYGEEANSLKSQSSDDRDQLSGSIGQFNTHHITVRGLSPNTKYYYLIGTGSNSTFDNNGQSFEITTAKRNGAPSAAKTAYGSILNESGGPAEGSVVYVTINGVGEMSSLVKNSGSWAIPLSNARLSDGSGYAELTDDQSMLISVQGPSPSSTSSLTTTIAQSQPVDSITLGQMGVVADTTSTSVSPSPTTTTEDEYVISDVSTSDDTQTTGGLNDLVNEDASDSAMIATDLEEEVVVATSQPVITGEAAPNVLVTIEVHSDTQINEQVVSDEDGNFELDIAALSEDLEPGEHTITYSYTDPTTGELVTTTKTFTVDPTDTTAGNTVDTTVAPTQLAQANTASATSTGPYGTGNPYPIGGATSSATATTSTKVSTRSSQVATSSTLPKSGSVETTLALIIGGIFFIISGGWSFWIASELREESLE